MASPKIDITELTAAIRAAINSPDPILEKTRPEEQNSLLEVTKALLDKLEGPDIGLIKVVFGVRSTILHDSKSFTQIITASSTCSAQVCF